MLVLRNNGVNLATLTIFSIATGRYFPFWENMVASASREIDNSIKVEFYLAGDSQAIFNEWRERNKGIESRFVTVPNLPWPLPTLLRFKYLNLILKEIDSDYLMYLDADMEFISKFSRENLDFIGNSGVTLVKHPGYFRTSRLEILNNFGFLRFLRILVSDIRLKLKYFGIGTWETNRSSSAFVPKSQRKQYVCGGTWWGKKESIQKLSHELEFKIDQDLSNNLIAKYHDESHLNYWAANNPCLLVGPEFCFDARLVFAKNMKPIIRAVNKNVDGLWNRMEPVKEN